MEYKDYIEEAKKYLLQNSSSQSAYEDYYNKAVKNLNNSYSTSAGVIGNEYVSDTNNAAAKNKLDSKNIAQYMASRGLSRSGEAEQETINSNLSLNRTLSDLASSKYKALSELYQNKNEALLELEKEYADKKSENEDWLNSAAFDLASAELAIDQKKEDEMREDARTTREDARTKSEREYEEYIRCLEAELNEAAAEKEREYEDKSREDEQQFELEKAAVNKSSGEQSGEQSGESGSADEGYTPSQSAATLAKTIIANYAADGKSISAITDRVKIREYLESLEDSGVSDDYLEELEFTLRASGYTTPGDTEVKANGIVDDSNSVYKSKYASYYKLYVSMGYPSNSADILAKTAAMSVRLDYCYTHSATVNMFEICCGILGITESDLNDYMLRLDAINSDSKYKKIGLNTAE